MKKHLISLITFILFGFLYTSSIFAQAPEKFTFQAEARDNQGTVIRNADIEVKITILEDSPTGIVWEGTHEITTDKYGMFTLNIGEGTGGYNFSAIKWANFSHFLNVKVTNSSGAADRYALYAGQAGARFIECEGVSTNGARIG